MKSVTINKIERARNKTIGKLVWNGKDLTSDPPENLLLLRLVDQKVMDIEKHELIFFKDDPDRWLEMLQYQYRSPYFNAGPVEEEQ